MELSWQAWLSVGVFGIAVVVIALDMVHMTLAMLLGVTVLFLTGVAGEEIREAGIVTVIPIISLFVASMVMIRCLEPTNLFAVLARQLYRFSRGDGRLLVVYTILLTALMCSVLPNATVVLLFTPLLIGVARLFSVPPLPLVILHVLAANTAGLLTVVGGIPTFLIARALEIGFSTYLLRVAPGALVALSALLVLSPRLFPTVWNARRPLPGERSGRTEQTAAQVRRPVILAVLLCILVTAAILFGVGEFLPFPMSPVVTAVGAGTLAIAVVHLSGLDDFGRIIRDIDWETILFFDAVFMLIEAMRATGVFDAVGKLMALVLGADPVITAAVVMTSIGALSCLMPNIPLTAVMIPTITSYMITAGIGAAGSGLAGANGGVGIMVALLFGVTLGGNAALIGAVPNLIAAGACRKEGIEVPFATFMRFGLPVAAAQIAVCLGYIYLVFL
jgi:Na+/H+ antiporter NhaD/arsenite permease-like protein